MVTRKPPKNNKTQAARPILQWAMASVGVLATLFVIGVVVWEAAQPKDPPSLTVHLVRVERTAAGQVALVKVVNNGDDTAAAVDIEGVLDAENATATVDYVPGHGHAKAYLQFSSDPRSAVLSVKGWSAP